MNDLMSSMSSQFQRAICEAINEQALSQNKDTLRSGQGQVEDGKSRAEGRNVDLKKS